MGDNGKRISVLRLNLKVSESSPVIKEFSEYASGDFETTICSLFWAGVEKKSAHVEYLFGDNTLRGFVSALSKALGNRTYEIIHSHYAHVGAIYTVYALLRPRARQTLGRSVYTVHTSFENLKFRNRILTAIVFLSHRRIVFCGHASAASFPSWFLRLASDKSRIILNGINTEEIKQISSTVPAQPSSRLRIVAVGRLISSKNFETAIHAIRDLDATLTIIGDGELKDSLMNVAVENGVQDRVKFVGMIPRKEVYRYLIQSDILISASFVEGLPKAVLESMACGCLPVLSDISAHREISDSVDKRIPLILPTDAQSFARAMKDIGQMNAQRRQELSRMYISAVETKFSLTRMLSEYRALYCELMHERTD